MMFVPLQKKFGVIHKIINSFSPASKKKAVTEISKTKEIDEDKVDEVDLQCLKQISKKRDEVFNVARKLIVKGMSTKVWKPCNVPWLLKRTSTLSIEYIVEVAKARKSYELANECKTCVHDFYNSDCF